MLKHALMAAGTALAALVLITSGSAASATEVEPVSSVALAAVIHVPEGTTVAALSIPGGPQSGSSGSVSGCTAGGVVNVAFILRYSLTGGSSEAPVTSEIPMVFWPSLNVPESGVVDFSFAPIAEWLDMHQPGAIAGAEIILSAACANFLDGSAVTGSTVTQVIPSGANFGSPTPTAPSPETDPVLPPDPASPPLPDVEPVGVAEEPVAGGAGTEVLAETGVDDAALAVPFAVGLLLVLSGVGLRLRNTTRSSKI